MDTSGNVIHQSTTSSNTGTWQTANWQYNSGSAIIANPEVDQLRQDIELLRTAHLNIAKDQENRICELENAVTELMDYVKEQHRLSEEQKEKIAKDLENAQALHQQYTQAFVQSSLSASHQHALIQGQPGQAIPLSTQYPTIGGAGLMNQLGLGQLFGKKQP